MLGYSLGVRAERGRREREQDAYEEQQYKRSRRDGRVVMSTIRIRR